MKDTEALYKQHENAVKYIQKIGAPQHHFRDGSVGRLNSLSVTTEICHQQNSGDTNYWKDSTFDAALTLAVKQNFQMLAEQALVLMKNDADNTLLEEKEALKARLKKIEELESEQPSCERNKSEGETQ